MTGSISGKPFRDWRLAGKFSLLMLVVLMLTGLAFFAAIRGGWTRSLYAAHHAKGIAVARHLAAAVVEPLLLDEPVRLQLALTHALTEKTGGDIGYVFLTDPRGEVLAHTFGHGFPSDLKGLNRPAPGADASILAIASESGLYHDIAVPVLQGEAGFVHLGLAARTIVGDLERITGSIVVICLLVSCAAIVATIFLVKYITRPLGALAQGVQHVAQGDFSHRVVVAGHDEIGLVAEAFNRMAATLEHDTGLRLAAEESLRKSEDMYRTLVENIDLGIILIDRDHNVVKANAAQGRIFGKDQAAFIGRKCFQEFEKRSAICEHCPGVAAMAKGQVAERRVEGVRDDGSRMTANVFAFPLMGPDGLATGFIEVVEDITNRKRLEDELHRAKKIESIGLLAGGIAHDFNNLLMGILGNASLAKLYAGDNEQAATKIAEMEKAVKRAAGLTKQLLTFAKGGAPVLTPTDLGKLIRETVSFVLSGSGVRCDYHLAGNLWPIEADTSQISQVLQNLAMNAKQAMADGGVLEVHAGNVGITEGSHPNLKPGRYARVLVVDHGIGIPPAHLDRVFDPFFSTKAQGSGLGLAICYSIVKKHGGTIGVRLTPEGGTTFEVLLPAAQGAGKETVPVVREVTGQGRVLLMDDEEVVRQVVGEMLRALGLTVQVAKDGDGAVDVYKREAEAGRRFDLVIMDLLIPGGLGGKEAMAILRDYDPAIKAVVSSGYSEDPVMGNFRAHGFVGAMAKPYDIEMLRRKLQEIM